MNGVPPLRRRTTQHAEAIKLAWASYALDRSDANRNRVAEQYLDFVKRFATALHAKLPADVQIDDLESAGNIGLLGAVEDFQPQRGNKFETYCSPRIRGAMLDHLRALDWTPRQVRNLHKRIDVARREFQQEHGRQPVIDELAKRLAVSTAKLSQVLKGPGAGLPGVVSLNRKCFENDSGKEVREADVLADKTAPCPSARATQRDELRKIVEGLPRAHRLIIILYYFEAMTQREIGDCLGLSESRVSQVHTAILLQLRAKMERQAERAA